jgi:cyclohexanone monooxygenase
MSEITNRDERAADGDAPARKSAADKLGFDPDALWAKYQKERERRLRPDGNKQYVALEEAFDHLANDPWLKERKPREPLIRHVEVAIVGGGFGGLLTGARLKQQGVDDIMIIEKGGDFGGTWYWNQYPGVACDTDAYIYLPMLEELSYIPTEKYAKGVEVRAHCRAIAEQFGLYERACFETRVTELRWCEDSARWIVRTDRGDEISARFAIAANGFLHLPKLPRLPGLSSFKGKTFHTSRWDYDYTGGDTNGNLTKLADKTVAIIGTGATAIQVVPHLAEWAKRLYVFQRTPSSVGVRNDCSTDPAWAASLPPGWQKRRRENFASLVAGGREDEDLVDDFWTRVAFNVALLEGPDADPEGIAQSNFDLRQIADFQVMEEVRKRVDDIVSDPATAELLKPYYNMMCKRPCLHNGYLETFNRPNVKLIDTSHVGGVERITETGLVVGGTEYPVDCIVFGTGFEMRTHLTRQGGYDIFGRDGLSLTEKWESGGDATLHGIASHGFPNCFFVNYSQAGVGANFVHFIDEQSKHIAYIVHASIARDAETVEVAQAAEQGWIDEIVATHASAWLVSNTDFQSTCTPGLYNDEGVKGRPVQNRSYAPGLVAYVRLLEAWRAQDALDGFEIVARS